MRASAACAVSGVPYTEGVRNALRRRAATLIEVMLAVALGLGILGFVFQVSRFFTVRTATSTAEIQRLREASLFFERVRRLLRFQASRVVRLGGGEFLVLVPFQGPDGEPGVLETLISVDPETGEARITDPDGTVHRYDLGERARLVLEQLEEDGTVLVGAEGEEPVGDLTGLLLPLKGRDGDFVTDDAGVLDALLAGEGGAPWASAETLDEAGAPEVTQSGFDLATLSPAEGDVPENTGAEQDLDLEADVLGIELTNVGAVFLPPAGVYGLAPTGQGAVEARLRAGGLGGA